MNSSTISIYDFPKYYDLVFGSDWKPELDFLFYCFERYADGNVQRVFEPACGTGRLLFRLARDGYFIDGIDLNEKAVEYCNRRLKKHGCPQRVRIGDMTDFELEYRADAAFNTINSFRHLTTEQAANDHLCCISDSLRDGGIYVLGLHLLPLKGESCTEEAWSASRGHLTVNTRMWQIDLDQKARVETFRMQFDIYTPTDIQSIDDDIQFRTYTRPQIMELIESTPFDLVGVYDFSYETDQVVELDDQTEDVILILKKC